MEADLDMNQMHKLIITLLHETCIPKDKKRSKLLVFKDTNKPYEDDGMCLDGGILIYRFQWRKQKIIVNIAAHSLSAVSQNS